MTDAFQPTETEVVTEVKFEDFVGEGKRYKTNDDAARAIAEKDAFIERLKREAADAREAAQKAAEAASKRMTEEDFLTRLEELSKGRQPGQQDDPAIPGVNTNSLTTEDIDRRFEELEAQKRRQTNLNTVVSKLQSAFGDDYKRQIQKQAQALGVTTQYLTDVAQNSPEAFFRLVGITQTQSKVTDITPPKTQMTTVPSVNSGEKKYKDFVAMRREKGDAWYFSIPVQQEIWSLAKAQGEDFYS